MCIRDSKHTVIAHLWLERWPSWEQCRRYPTPRPCRQGPVCSDTGTHTEAGLVVTALSLSERSCTESLSSVTWNRASQTAHTAYNTAHTAYLCSAADTRIFHVPDGQEDPGGEILSIHWTCALELPLSIKHSSSLSSFKSKLQTHLFSSAYCHFTNPSPVMHVFGVWVWVWVCVCVCVCVWWNECILVSLYALWALTKWGAINNLLLLL